MRERDGSHVRKEKVSMIFNDIRIQPFFSTADPFVYYTYFKQKQHLKLMRDRPEAVRKFRFNSLTGVLIMIETRNGKIFHGIRVTFHFLVRYDHKDSI